MRTLIDTQEEAIKLGVGHFRTEFDVFMEELEKNIVAYEHHDFKGHFHDYSKAFLSYMISDMRTNFLYYR